MKSPKAPAPTDNPVGEIAELLGVEPMDAYRSMIRLAAVVIRGNIKAGIDPLRPPKPR